MAAKPRALPGRVTTTTQVVFRDWFSSVWTLGTVKIVWIKLFGKKKIRRRLLTTDLVLILGRSLHQSEREGCIGLVDLKKKKFPLDMSFFMSSARVTWPCHVTEATFYPCGGWEASKPRVASPHFPQPSGEWTADLKVCVRHNTEALKLS